MNIITKNTDAIKIALNLNLGQVDRKICALKLLYLYMHAK